MATFRCGGPGAPGELPDAWLEDLRRRGPCPVHDPELAGVPDLADLPCTCPPITGQDVLFGDRLDDEERDR